MNLPFFSLEEDKMNVSNNFPYSEVKYEIKYVFFFCHNLFQKWRFHIAAISIIGQLQFSAELSSKATQKSNSSQQDISCTLTLKTQRWNVIGSGCRYCLLSPSVLPPFHSSGVLCELAGLRGQVLTSPLSLSVTRSPSLPLQPSRPLATRERVI